MSNKKLPNNKHVPLTAQQMAFMPDHREEDAARCPRGARRGESETHPG